MKLWKLSARRLLLSFGSVLCLTFGGYAYAQPAFPVPPTSFAPFKINPNGVAATQFTLFTTYDGDQANVYRIDALGFPHLFGTLPINPSSMPAEVYLAISAGLGGFTANDLFVVRGNQVFRIPAAGGAGILFHDFTGNGVPYAVHSGITFDAGGLMYVTFENGTVWSLNSLGGAAQVMAGLANAVTEGPAAGAGFLLVTQEQLNQVFKITIPGAVVSSFGAFTGTESPEAALIVPSNLCTFGLSGGAFFSTAEESNFLLSYPPVDFGPPSSVVPGDVVVPLEGFDPGDKQGIAILDSTGATRKYFDNTPHVHEGSTFVQCNVPPPASHCTLTQGGYKNKFNSLLTAFFPGSLTLGSVSYSNAQLDQIMQNNAVKGNGLISLAHQLITAELNIYYGTIPSQAVLDAINTANSLIGSLVIPPVGSGFLAPSATSATESTLDTFNNSNECK